MPWLSSPAGSSLPICCTLSPAARQGFDQCTNGFAQNGFDEGSPGEYSLATALMIEVVLTAGILIVILGVTDGRAPAGLAPIAIGLALTRIRLISIPITDTSVNPARSTGSALVVG